MTSLTTFSDDDPQTIYLYTAPLRGDFVNNKFKKPIGIFAHWAVCIQGICYEVAQGDKKKGEPKYLYKSTPEREWIKSRPYADRLTRKLVGNMTKPYTRETIDKKASQVWKTTLNEKYVLDEGNCQVFARFLVEVIGDQNAKDNLGHFFDIWVRNAGITRDFAILGLIGGATLMAVGLVTFTVDGGTTAAAGFSVAASTVCNSIAGMASIKRKKEKRIQKAQKAIMDQEMGKELERNDAA